MLRQPELRCPCPEQGISRATVGKWRVKQGGMDVPDEPDDGPCSPAGVLADLLREALGKDVTRPVRRRELAAKAVGRDEGGAWRWRVGPFDVSETCCRCCPKRDEENEMIADLQVGLGNGHRTWGRPLASCTCAA